MSLWQEARPGYANSRRGPRTPCPRNRLTSNVLVSLNAPIANNPPTCTQGRITARNTVNLTGQTEGQQSRPAAPCTTRIPSIRSPLSSTR